MKVTLEDGFGLEIDERRLDDYELLEALVDVDKGKTVRILDAVDLLLGEEKPKLLDHIKEETGYASTNKVKNAVLRIFEEMKNGKKA